MTYIVAIVFPLLLIMAVPVAHALLISGGIAILLSDTFLDFSFLSVKLYSPTQSFPMLAIPFFILAGDLMMSGKIGNYLVDISKLVVGRFKGGLAQVSVLGSLMFGGVSGSAVADASALGNALIPVQKKEGYPLGYAAAVNAASSTISVLIPPSIPLILFGLVSETSIIDLFIAGVVPGIMLAVSMLLICDVVGRVKDLPRSPMEGGFKAYKSKAYKALPAILMPIFIVLTLRFGLATPTEISVIAVGYALLVGIFIYRDVNIKLIIRCMITAGMMTGIVMLVIMGSAVIQHIMTMERVPIKIAEWMLGVFEEPWKVILAMNVLMLIIGTFLDLPAAVLLLTPIFLGVANQVGLNNIQLGVMMVINLSIGLYTPPVGTTLFVSASIAQTNIGSIVKSLVPFYLMALLVLALVSFVPMFTSILL